MIGARGIEICQMIRTRLKGVLTGLDIVNQQVPSLFSMKAAEPLLDREGRRDSDEPLEDTAAGETPEEEDIEVSDAEISPLELTSKRLRSQSQQRHGHVYGLPCRPGDGDSGHLQFRPGSREERSDGRLL